MRAQIRQTKPETETEKKSRKREARNTRSDKGEGPIDKTRADVETKKRLKLRSWNLCGFATEERQRI